MQVTASVSSSSVATNFEAEAPMAENRQSKYEDYKVIRRNGAVVAFEPAKIEFAAVIEATTP